MPTIDSEKARRVLMNAKAISAHLFRIEDLTREAGIDLTSETDPCSLAVNEFHASCMHFLTQMEVLAAVSGIAPESDDSNTVNQFLDRRCGVRPYHVRDEDE
ncbi:hypothetical protein ABZ897_49750 [Nonomuraea sp. NPDC046802]|uniref:hypothetical protein n=1 Tax=Nonomuraea sp. NPDC046802 TaxID=3154919 RepID=UPI0033E01C94